MSMTRQEIDAWAAENFMTKVRITTEYSDTVEAGRVIRFEINDDRVVMRSEETARFI
jgi:beta-lactam-binding protein with PASTA domain